MGARNLCPHICEECRRLAEASDDISPELQFSLSLAGASPARATDPETAGIAAGANPDARGRQRLLILRFLRECDDFGATDYEAGCAVGILRTSAGKRRKELCERGLVRNSGLRRMTDTGSTAIVWQAIPKEELE